MAAFLGSEPAAFHTWCNLTLIGEPPPSIPTINIYEEYVYAYANYSHFLELAQASCRPACRAIVRRRWRCRP